LPGQRLYVLDRLGEPVPVGVRGELFIGGSGVRRGYWNRPALTADRFVPDPFGPVPGGRLCRTGDAARWLPTGDLEFLGRLDQQVKIRGMRVELGEIESALAAHPDVREAVVVLQPAGADERLAAYVVADGPLPPSAARLRRHLAERLPRHMVPSAFVPLDRLPLLPSGKLDRSALPAPPPTRQDLATTFTAPSTPLERVLAGIWADVIELDRVGVTDDFFELGGHSLLVTQVVHRIRELLRVSASVQTFLSTCTVAALAQALRAEGAEAGVDVDRAAELALAVSAMDEDEVAAQLARGSG